MIKEACAETFEEAQKAEQQGADRIELCSELANDGLTPSLDPMQKTCAALKIPAMIMIRPRAGNFVHSEEEINKMKTDIDLAKQAGAAGVVFGLLTADNKIDVANTRLLAGYAHPLPVTFHKAIDELENPVEGVEALKKISGIKRTLTSGGKPIAMEGLETLKKMLQTADGNPIIMIAGKVTDKNVEDLQQLTGAVEFHGRRIAGNISE
jgi:copper homeostasis protein